jgi:4-carboxymuconolactone decarboxylase
MAEDETAAYEFSMELHRNKSVSDATYARALELFGEQGIIDLTGLNGYYSMLAMMMNVARTPNDNADVKPLEAFPN